MVNLAGVFGAAMASIYEDATLHRPGATTDDGTGTITTAPPSDHTCKAQIDTATEAMRRDEGYASTDVRILVPTATVDVEPTTDDTITAGGQEWRIMSVQSDPARGAWDMRGRRA